MKGMMIFLMSKHEKQECILIHHLPEVVSRNIILYAALHHKAEN